MNGYDEIPTGVQIDCVAMPVPPYALHAEDIAQWKQQVREISVWLYERDPTGATGGGTSPNDEYDGEETRILSGVQNATTASRCVTVVRDVFDRVFGLP